MQQKQEDLFAACSRSGMAVLFLAPDGSVQGANDKAKELCGTAPQCAEATLKNLIGEQNAVAVLEALARGAALEDYEVQRALDEVELLCQLVPQREATGEVNGALFMARDVSEERRLSRELRALQSSSRDRAVVLETASRVALGILSSRTGTEALRHIADAARILSGARYAALGVARLDGEGLEEFVTIGLTPEEHASIGSLPQGKGVLGLLLHRQEPLRLDNIGAHPKSAGFPRNHPPMKSFLGVPIRRGDEVLGSLYLTDKQGGGSFTLADETAVQALGAHAAVAIHNLHLLKRQRALTKSLITAQEEERRAVAYDLHDGLTQFVMAAQAHLEAFKRARVGDNAEKAARELETGLKYLKDAVIESRRLINGLRSLALDDLGLVGALELLVGEEKSRAAWSEARFHHNIAEHRFDWTLETGAYRVAQEALTNARKHAHTERVQLSLHEENRRLILEVRDWGRGFAPREQTDTSRVGLQSMAERVNLLGGNFEINSREGQGTLIRATFPIIEVKKEE